MSEIFVRLGEQRRPPPERHPPPQLAGGVELPDPYLLEGSPVLLSGGFDALGTIQILDGHRFASFQPRAGGLGAPPFARHYSNLLLVDALWRFGSVQSTGPQSLGVYVPERCPSMKVFYDFLGGGEAVPSATFTGRAPRADGDRLHLGSLAAWDVAGRLLLEVEGGVCRRFGEVSLVTAGDEVIGG